jgi:hypothetical protein
MKLSEIKNMNRIVDRIKDQLFHCRGTGYIRNQFQVDIKSQLCKEILNQISNGFEHTVFLNIIILDDCIGDQIDQYYM